MTGRSVVFFSLGFLKYLLADFVQRGDFLKEKTTGTVMQRMRLLGCATEPLAHVLEITGRYLSHRDGRRPEFITTSDFCMLLTRWSSSPSIHCFQPRLAFSPF